MEANYCYRVTLQNYISLIKGIENYSPVEHSDFIIEINKTGSQGSNTYSLFIYGYEVTIDLIMIFQSEYGYLGKILCTLNADTVISELYIDRREALVSDIEAIYPKGQLGVCGRPSTTNSFLKHIAKKVLAQC